MQLSIVLLSQKSRDLLYVYIATSKVRQTLGSVKPTPTIIHNYVIHITDATWLKFSSE